MRMIWILTALLLCSSSVLASPVGFEELLQLEDHQASVLRELQDDTSQLGSLSEQEKLTKIEMMMKHYSRVEDATLASGTRGVTCLGKPAQRPSTSSSHLGLLRRHELMYREAIALSHRQLSSN